MLGTTGASSTPLGYDGQYTNTDTGLIYLRAREYDPATGQFLTVDPDVDGTHEPYSYTADDPANHGDTSGLLYDACHSVTAPCGVLEHLHALERKHASRRELEAEINATLFTTLQHFGAPEPKEGLDYDIEFLENGYILREPGTTGMENAIRVMGPSAANPEGSLVYYDEYGHPVDYETGKVPKTRAGYHVPYGNETPLQNFPRWFTGE